MIRQKIKGNGKSRRITTPSSPLPSSSDHSSLSSHEHRQQEATKNVLADEDSSMAAEEKRMPNRVQSSSDLHDGDLQMFHGKPFHFVNYISSRDQLPPLEVIVQQPKQQIMLPANNAIVTPLFSKPTSSKIETRAYLKTMLAPYFEVPEHLPRRQSLIFSF
jgi:hypothetical protein